MLQLLKRKIIFYIDAEHESQRRYSLRNTDLDLLMFEIREAWQLNPTTL
jgi:hypothetical protein